MGGSSQLRDEARADGMGCQSWLSIWTFRVRSATRSGEQTFKKCSQHLRRYVLYILATDDSPRLSLLPLFKSKPLNPRGTGRRTYDSTTTSTYERRTAQLLTCCCRFDFITGTSAPRSDEGSAPLYQLSPKALLAEMNGIANVATLRDAVVRARGGTPTRRDVTRTQWPKLTAARPMRLLSSEYGL